MTGGLLGVILAGAFWCSLSMALFGGVEGGITGFTNGGNVLEGIADGAFKGAKTGAIIGAIAASVFVGIGIAGCALGTYLGGACRFADSAGKILQVLNATSKTTRVLSIGMAAFDTGALVGGILSPNNSWTVLNKNFHSNGLYNTFQITVTALAVFSGAARYSMNTRLQAGSPVCFVAGTMILTATGLVAIEKIRAGDKVVSTNADTFETAEKQVLETYIRKSSSLVHIWIDDRKTSVTPNHPYWVLEKGWVDAGELTALDQLQKSNGDVTSIQKIEFEETDDPVIVYNFEVEDFHTYYAGDIAVLVHNADYSKTFATDWTGKTEELAKSSPINIPDNAIVKIQAKTGYDQITYKWNEGGCKYEVRWHTPTPKAPAGTGNSWVISRVTSGTPVGQVRVENIYTGIGDGWTPRWEWQVAIDAYNNGTMTATQEALLKTGHWIAP